MTPSFSDLVRRKKLSATWLGLLQSVEGFRSKLGDVLKNKRYYRPQ